MLRIEISVTWDGADPEFGDAEPTTPHQCEDGFVSVSTAYVESLVPMPDLPPDTDPAIAAEIVAQIEARRAAIVNTYYPCKDCRPHLFARWAAGRLVDREDEPRGTKSAASQP